MSRKKKQFDTKIIKYNMIVHVKYISGVSYISKCVYSNEAIIY